MVRLPEPLRPLFPVLKPAYTAATRVVAPVNVALGKRRAAPGLPTGWVETTEKAALTTGGRWLPARPAETVTRTMPASGPADAIFAAELTEQVKRTVVAELPNARVLGPHHAVITGRGDLVQDLSWYFGTNHPQEHPLFLHPLVHPPLEMVGRIGVLATRGDVNYYHFLMDVLPRLGVYAAAGEVDEPSMWYVPMDKPFQKELLDLVGLKPVQLLDSAQHPHMRAETLIVPSPPSMVVANPPWVVEWLRARLLGALPARVSRVPGRGVYVTRGASANNRAVTNEDAVIAALTARGFDIVDPAAMTVADQIRTFAEASVIVSAHGAALANLVFASPGATVVELFPAGNLVPDYWKLACGVPGLTYRYQLGKGADRGVNRSRLLVSDIEVDVPALQRLMDELG